MGSDEFVPLRFAYADPPYLGCCRLYDHEHGDDGRCWDHPRTHRYLIERLAGEYPDGWALSCTSVSLATLLPMVRQNVAEHRIGAWVKPFHTYKKGVRPAYSWEPVIYTGGRNPMAGYKHAPPLKGGKATTPKDHHISEAPALACNITLKKGLTGAKPEPFCEWVLALLNAQPGDTLDDLFTGTGVMGRVASASLSASRPASPVAAGDCVEVDDE